MNDDERRKAPKVPAIASQKVLQPVGQQGGRDVGIMDLPAFDRKALHQITELFGNKPGVFQNLKPDRKAAKFERIAA